MTVFDQSCSLCHVLGREKGDDPREKIVLDPSQKKWTEAWVRRWLADPLVVKPDSMCLAHHLDPVQKDLLVSFLRVQHTRGAALARVRHASDANRVPPMRIKVTKRAAAGGGDR